MRTIIPFSSARCFTLTADVLSLRQRTQTTRDEDVQLETRMLLRALLARFELSSQTLHRARRRVPLSTE